MTAVGNYVIDLHVLQDAGAFSNIQDLDQNVFSNSTLNSFLEHPPKVWGKVRERLLDILTKDKNGLLSSDGMLQLAALHDIENVTMCLPVDVGDYTDFYSSREHATNGAFVYKTKMDDVSLCTS